MEDQILRSAARPIMAFALLLLVIACGGKQTVASRSAEAFREAQQKGTPLGGDSHGGHSAGQSTDHSNMKSGDMAGMDHSKMKPGGMAGMDHSKMKPGGMAGMDRGAMPGMQHGAPGPAVMKVPTSNSEMQRMSPASTLGTDEFDAPSPASVSESSKATQEGGREGHSMGGMAPSQESPAQSEPAVDHSQHGQPPETTKPGTQSQPKRTVSQPSQPVAAIVYTCPMHPEVRSSKPGKCPKCGMALVKKQ